MKNNSPEASEPQVLTRAGVAGPRLGGIGRFWFNGHGGAGIDVCLKTLAECNRRKRASMDPPTLRSLGPDVLKSVRGSGQREGGKGLFPVSVFSDADAEAWGSIRCLKVTE